MQSRTSGDTTNRFVAALRVVFVGIRIFKLEFKIGPQKNDLTRVCLRSHNSGKETAQSTFLAELHNLGQAHLDMSLVVFGPL